MRLKIAGYATNYFSIDDSGDVIFSQAFDAGREVPLQINHGERTIGRASLTPNRFGMRLKSEVDDSPMVRLAIALGGLSLAFDVYEKQPVTAATLQKLWHEVGYNPTPLDLERLRERGLFNLIVKGEITEVSIVREPACPGCEIDIVEIKAAPITRFTIPAIIPHQIMAAQKVSFYVPFPELRHEKTVPLLSEAGEKIGTVAPGGKVELTAAGADAARLIGEGKLTHVQVEPNIDFTMYLSDQELRRFWAAKGYRPGEFDLLVLNKFNSGIPVVCGTVKHFKLTGVPDGAIPIGR